MKFYVAKVTKTEKMVYLSCLRYIKKDDKYIAIPSTVSVKRSYYEDNVIEDGFFPFVIDVEFKKGIGAIIKPIAENTKDYAEKV